MKRADPQPVALVIFDCDGVLVDSERLAIKVEASLITELGWPLTEQEVLERFVGRTDSYMQREIEAALGRPVPEFHSTYQQRLHASFRSDLVAVAGVHQLLKALADAQIMTCVASSGTYDKMQLTLGLTGLADTFAGRIFSADEVEHGKPAPDLFLHAAACCGVTPDECVVIEDRRSGVEAARAAGMRAIGYAGGLTPAPWLEGPDTTVVRDMRTVSRLLIGPGNETPPF